MPDIFVAKKTKSPHLFSSFCEYPEGVVFVEQDEDEEILLFLRRDFVTNIPWLLIGLFLMFVPIFALWILNILHLPLTIASTSLTFLLFFYYLLIATYLAVSFITWYYNISLVTNKKIVDIDYSNLVYKNVAVTELSLVQDVSYTQVGVFSSLFDYGDILVQTAGTIDNFEFKSAPNPQRVAQIIENLIGKKKNDK